ncbi:MAG: glycosyltransferase family 10 domain-containing protein [Elainellaceae cyanobacterium]
MVQSPDKQTIGMVSSYVGLNPCPADWLWLQSPQPFGGWNGIQMLARSPRPDWLLLYQYSFPKPPAPGKLAFFRRPAPAAHPDLTTLLRGVPQERVIYLMREPPLEEVVDKHQRIYQKAEKYCGYVSGPEDFAPVPAYMPAIWYVGVSFRELDTLPPPLKTRTCSWITSGIDRTENHRRRLAFLHQLQDTGLGIDFYGRDLPETVAAVGPVGNKWYAMAPYYYNLAIENYADNGWYVSEKLWDALLAWCLPIYYGGPAADKLLPPESFLRLPSLDEKGIAYVQEIIASPDLWQARRGAIAEARQIILHKLNLLNWLSEFVERSA